MNQWYIGWLEVQARVDKINLYMFFIAVTGLIWYRLWFYKFAKAVMIAMAVIFGFCIVGDLWR